MICVENYMNKIISMSVWGKDPRYIVGAKRQIELCRKYYPDWRIRLYVDDASNFKDDDVDLYEVRDGTYGMFWRFYPMFEDPNNITLCRDSDSRITIREAACVEEWMSSDKMFHTFKDHDAHYEFPIIGCAFGFRGMFGEQLLVMMKRYMTEYKQYLSDQFYLRDYIWPVVKSNSLVHSMNEPGWFSDTRKKLKNKFSFCGNGYDENDMPLYPDSLKNIEKFNPKEVSETFKFDEGVMYE